MQGENETCKWQNKKWNKKHKEIVNIFISTDYLSVSEIMQLCVVLVRLLLIGDLPCDIFSHMDYIVEHIGLKMFILLPCQSQMWTLPIFHDFFHFWHETEHKTSLHFELMQRILKGQRFIFIHFNWKWNTHYSMPFSFRFLWLMKWTRPSHSWPINEMYTQNLNRMWTLSSCKLLNGFAN